MEVLGKGTPNEEAAGEGLLNLCLRSLSCPCCHCCQADLEDTLTSFTRADQARREARLEARPHPLQPAPHPQGCLHHGLGPGTEQRQLLRILHRLAEEWEHPAAPFAGQAAVVLGWERKDFYLREETEEVSASGKARQKRWMSREEHQATGHQFPNYFSAQIP